MSQGQTEIFFVAGLWNSGCACLPPRQGEGMIVPCQSLPTPCYFLEQRLGTSLGPQPTLREHAPAVASDRTVGRSNMGAKEGGKKRTLQSSPTRNPKRGKNDGKPVAVSSESDQVRCV